GEVQDLYKLSRVEAGFEVLGKCGDTENDAGNKEKVSTLHNGLTICRNENNLKTVCYAKMLPTNVVKQF
ncbi:MAG: hypothetical protein ACTHJ0_06435, partial [Flavipsychrobacter sp.]